MDIKIDNVKSVDFVSSKSSSYKNVSTVRIYSEGGNSFSLVFKHGDAESIKKIKDALTLSENYLND